MFDDGHHTDEHEAERTRLQWLLMRASRRRREALKVLDQADLELARIRRRLGQL